jgi:hypothetical protein
MGFFSTYCEKCGVNFVEDMSAEISDNAKEIYGDKIPEELKKIIKSNHLTKGFFISNNVKYYLKNYNYYGAFTVEKYEYLSKSSAGTKPEMKVGDKLNIMDYEGEPYTLTHRKCHDIFIKYRRIAERFQGQFFEIEEFLRIVFPKSLSDRNDRIRQLLYVYHPVWDTLIRKDNEYIAKEKKCKEGYILNPASFRFVSKTGKIGKKIFEKSEKIYHLVKDKE